MFFVWQEVTFRWDQGNETFTQHSQEGEAGSELRIEIQADSLGSLQSILGHSLITFYKGDYVCYVNNSIGESDPCSIQTQGEELHQKINSKFLKNHYKQHSDKKSIAQELTNEV